MRLPELIRRGVRSGVGSAWLTVGGVKMFLDGSLGSRTAWMLEPYEGSRDRGMPITAESDGRIAMEMAAAAGIASTVHAIGDAAVRRALDLMTRLDRVAIPHRIEHFQCVHPADLDRAAAAGHRALDAARAPADRCPAGRTSLGRARGGAYAFRTLLRKGSAIVFGSDVPVASIDPREGVFAALERQATRWYAGRWLAAGGETDFEDAVRAYTAEAAAAALARRIVARSARAWTPTSWRGTSTPRSITMTGMPFGRAGPYSRSSVERS